MGTRRINNPKRPGAGARSGQSLVESCVAIAIICLILMGLLQLSRIFTAQEILDFAAGRAARCRIVGFNEFMVYKTVRVASIANAGRLVYPQVEGGPLAQRAIERANIPLYMGGMNGGQLPFLLDYENWSSVNYSMIEHSDPPMVRMNVRQNYRIFTPVFRAFYSRDTMGMSGSSEMENHYPLYLEAQ